MSYEYLTLQPTHPIRYNPGFWEEEKPIPELIDLNGVIYKIINLKNGKVYIGKTNRSFRERYKGGKWWKWSKNDLLKSDYEKFGKEAFVLDIIANNISPEDLVHLESLLIVTHNSLHPNGYNKILEQNNTHIISDITKKKMSDSAKKRLETHKNNFFGKRHTEETKKILSVKAKQRTPSPEDKLKQKQNCLRGDKHKARHSKGFIPVIQVDPLTKQIIAKFSNILEAKNITGVDCKSIKSSCLSQKRRAGGYVWRFKEEDIPLFDFDYDCMASKKRSVLKINELTEEIIETYSSVTEAASMNSLDFYKIYYCCKNNSKSICGFKWKFKNEIN